MPFAPGNCFTFVQMGMMPVGMLMVMDMFHKDMGMDMFVR